MKSHSSTKQRSVKQTATRARRGVATKAPKQRKPQHAIRAPRRAMAQQVDLFDGNNAAYVDSMYQQWKTNPSSVHASWAAYFNTSGEFVTPPGLGLGVQTARPLTIGGGSAGGADATAVRVGQLVAAYRQFGHLEAQIDPLGIHKERGAASLRARLNPATYGLTDADLEKVVDLSAFGELAHLAARPTKVADIIATAKNTYSKSIGVEFEHLGSQEERDFLYQAVESIPSQQYDKTQRLTMLKQLNKAVSFEKFLRQKYNVKRFGLEGGESTVVALSQLLSQAADDGVEHAVMGMAHRGRLNILTNIVGKPLDILLSEFTGNYDAREAQHADADNHFVTDFQHYPHAGDVKYHQGWSAENELDNGKKLHVTMLPNPSHLETVNPLVLGAAKAIQDEQDDVTSDRSLSVLLHGDAAVAGQGVVAETFNAHGIKGYHVGGTIHIIINNQIGFTTDPESDRSGTYASDIGKAFEAPILHVNGDDVEAVARVSALAAQYRKKFKKDIIIDLNCYRVNGHNELDQPSFTQPTMYNVIAKQQDPYEKYKQHLLQGAAITEAEANVIEEAVQVNLRDNFEAAKEFKEPPHQTQERPGPWAALAGPMERVKLLEPTGVETSVLRQLGKELAAIPDGFVLHKGVKNVYKDRAKFVEQGTGIDWGTAEALAFASLLAEGHDLRIAGQDAQRGTFSHRHAVVHEQSTNDQYTPLHHLSPVNGKKIGKFTALNSYLSEYACMGYELGHSLHTPNTVNIWEAQFGDFANGAQIILDQYLSCTEAKWGKQTGLVLLLPHGYEGQGAEHSSARVERFLQAANDDADFVPQTDEQHDAYIRRNNWQVANFTTGANYFHALRRQVKRNIRKPLIVMSPKSLLRHPGASSTYEDLNVDAEFQPVLADPNVKDPAAVKRHIVVSGKVYFELTQEMEKRQIDPSQFAISRIEQIAPFPFREIETEIKKYPNAEVVWAQEEHKNAGAGGYTVPRLEALLNKKVKYFGRPPSAAAACGSSIVHNQEWKQIFDTVFKI